MLAGIVSTQRYPRLAQTKAKPMPVLPLVGSTTTPPGTSLPLLLGALDHRQANAIFDRTAGVLRFELAEHVRARRVTPEPSDLDQRRVGDQIQHATVDEGVLGSGGSVGWASDDINVPLRSGAFQTLFFGSCTDVGDRHFIEAGFDSAREIAKDDFRDAA